MADHAPRVINVNFSPPSAGRIAAIFIGALIGVLLIAALWTSYYTVEAESEGVVLHFGKLNPGAFDTRRHCLVHCERQRILLFRPVHPDFPDRSFIADDDVGH